ncbi:hypothetical protein SAMN05660297_02631 [Natronincola peptidivorans]|uniref:Uncharacterized protein n=1 Tax=Natronincola peptidivorans TaxID=426128 RepID=A0A1I0F100_9FIRM|nr:hypothetical protein [Natronincola peptidivorans]SET51639.1 hypothetical protein SAMN05660297_02631 [Natronincola peptidivorans]
MKNILTSISRRKLYEKEYSPDNTSISLIESDKEEQEDYYNPLAQLLTLMVKELDNASI